MLNNYIEICREFEFFQCTVRDYQTDVIWPIYIKSGLDEPSSTILIDSEEFLNLTLCYVINLSLKHN